MEEQRIVRRAVLAFFGGGCFLFLLVCCYRPVLFEDGQFAYRDAAAFYYPLYLRVQQEWRAGRWPLWDPGQNGGEPLLGNPMAWTLWGLRAIDRLLRQGLRRGGAELALVLALQVLGGDPEAT
jgi:hypothetical protein